MIMRVLALRYHHGAVLLHRRDALQPRPVSDRSSSASHHLLHIQLARLSMARGPSPHSHASCIRRPATPASLLDRSPAPRHGDAYLDCLQTARRNRRPAAMTCPSSFPFRLTRMVAPSPHAEPSRPYIKSLSSWGRAVISLLLPQTLSCHTQSRWRLTASDQYERLA